MSWGNKLSVDAGVRAEVGGAIAGAPRVRWAPQASVRYQPIADFALWSAAGVQYQHEQTIKPQHQGRDGVVTDGVLWMLAGPAAPLARARVLSRRDRALVRHGCIALCDGVCAQQRRSRRERSAPRPAARPAAFRRRDRACCRCRVFRPTLGRALDRWRHVHAEPIAVRRPGIDLRRSDASPRRALHESRPLPRWWPAFRSIVHKRDRRSVHSRAPGRGPLASSTDASGASRRAPKRHRRSGEHRTDR